MIKVTIEDNETIVGIKDKHCWTLEDTVNVFQIVLNKFFDTDIEVFIKPKQKSTTEVPVLEAEGM
tara:strand:- start:145 stop:339 length:195 start_codon:yes stop_codon:yes gene_type:complete